MKPGESSVCLRPPVVRLQYLSDLNLEEKPSRFRRLLKPNAEILVLAGNIGRPSKRIYDQFLSWCSTRFSHVVLVPGNREYYQSTLKNAYRHLKRICTKHGVYLLERDLLEIPEWNLVILGSTLWPKISDSQMFEELRKNKDFQEIWDLSLSVEDSLHSSGKSFLEKQIKFYREKNPEYTIVVVTHHQPSNCENLMEGVTAWIHGHEGGNSSSLYKSTLVTSNQRSSKSYTKDGNLIFEGGAFNRNGRSS